MRGFTALSVLVVVTVVVIIIIILGELIFIT